MLAFSFFLGSACSVFGRSPVGAAGQLSSDIVFTQLAPARDSSGGAAAAARLVRLSPDGTLKVLSQGFFAARDPDISFDGKRILFAGKRMARDYWQVYEMNADGTLGSPLASGNGYTTGWSTITSVNLDGDADDEIFFYRDDGLFRFYQIRSDGTLPKAMLEGDGYTTDWTSVAAVDLDGDNQDEMFFYRDDGLFRYYNIGENARLSLPLLAGSDYTQGWSAVTALDVDHRPYAG